uniref:mitogen-activated protein kinase kinase n=1 Tax=Dugesia japonica TaxID=6161 RepID=A0A193PCD6_DUGJA|nr:MAPK/ERK kinase 1/2 [Dugesia japonica]
MSKNKLGLKILPATNREEDENNDNVDNHTASKPISRKHPPLRISFISSNRVSTGPMDVEEIQKKLESQKLDDTQRQKLFEFVAKKKNISELSADDFEFIAELGKGNGGVVSKVRYKPTNLIMARKNIHLEIKPAVKAQIIRELQVLHDCNSPYIVGYFGAFFSDGDISFCMEYMNAGSLDLVMKNAGRLPEPIVAKITISVVNGLIYLREELDIIHRDVKPSNILVNSDGEVKLCDFGVSGQLIDSMANSFVGTRSYMAPERLIGEEYNVRSDVWSLGLSLIELATGRYPIPPAKEEDFHSTFSQDRQVNLAEHLDAALYGKKLKAMQVSDSNNMAIFELLAYIVDYPPPRVPEFCFSNDFITFVHSCLQENALDRPRLESLLTYNFLLNPDKYLEQSQKKYDFSSIEVSFYLRNLLHGLSNDVM